METALADLKARLEGASPAWRRDDGYAAAQYAADVAWQGAYVFEAEYKRAEPSLQDTTHFGRRDRLMADNLLRLLRDGRGVLRAHDLHVASGLDLPTEAKGGRPLGAYLRQRLGASYQTVGFTWSRATVQAVALSDDASSPPISQRIVSDIRLENDRPGAFGHVFSALPGDGWWVDMDARPRTRALDRWGARPLWHGYAGWRVDSATWDTDYANEPPPDRGFDFLVWLRTMSPSRSWADSRQAQLR